MPFMVKLAVGVAVLTIPWALFSVPVMKYYARPLSVLRLFIIAAWAFLRVLLVVLAIAAAWMLISGKPNGPFAGLSGLIIVSGAGTLISRSLKRKGFSLPYPGIGARAMIGLFAISLLVLAVASMARLFKT
jgi:hypothetical protein